MTGGLPAPAGRVLLVDDDEALLGSMARLLRAEVAVATAPDGRGALEAMEAQGPFDVVVTDLKMPGMDGVELLSRISRSHPDTVRVLLTGHADMRAAIDAANLGYVYRFLTKPCPPELLLLELRQCLEHGRLERDRRELAAARRCRTLLEGVVRGFSSLVEARDPFLAGHQQRVTALALAMGRRLGMPLRELETLRVAGLLHDIGKVYIPADLLTRPGILREEELSLIRMHPEVGYELLKHLGGDWPVAVIIRQHHERMDGSGYPQGLTGSFITPGARILAVADVVEAMCSERAYRSSLGLDRALEEIAQNRGRLYDERCADACLELFVKCGYSLSEPAQNIWDFGD